MDAARIDGAQEFAIFRRIILPMIAPGLVSLGLIFFMGSWNDYLFPLVILKSPSNFTLPLTIQTLVSGGLGLPDLQFADGGFGRQHYSTLDHLSAVPAPLH